jgi:hypothetical protein
VTEWKPKPKVDANTEDMNLTGEEGSVLARVDGFTSMQNISLATGLPEGRVRQIVNKLVRQGAVDAQAEAEHQKTAVDTISPAELAEMLGATDDDAFEGTVTEEVPAPIPGISAPEEIQMDEASEAQERPDVSATADEASEETEAPAEEGEGEGDEEEEGNYRKLYMEKLSKLEAPERESMAKTAIDPELMALTFDPLHSVIRYMFENTKAGLAHARMVARHHHTPQGLDIVMAKAEFMRDTQMQRNLLLNTMLQEPQLKKLLQSKRLMDIYKIAISRDIPERNRTKSRNIMRSKWASAEGDERAGLVFSTEGRCLTMLQGLPFDSQMTTYLCSKTYNSVLLIQNLARFGATPPQVLSHLIRQPVVKRQQHLRTLIKQHPNCPSDVKRQA